MLSPSEERADLKTNPLPTEPDCGSCLHCCVPEAKCDLRDELDNADRCEYQPDELHDETLPLLEQAFRIREKMTSLQEELSEFQKRYDALLESIIAVKIEKQGPYVFIDKKRTVRIPDVELFKSAYGAEYEILKQERMAEYLKKFEELKEQDLPSIPVKRAEELVGKVKLTRISEEKVYHNYNIVLVDGKHSGEKNP
jgi:hypothetical protein